MEVTLRHAHGSIAVVALSQFLDVVVLSAILSVAKEIITTALSL